MSFVFKNSPIYSEKYLSNAQDIGSSNLNLCKELKSLIHVPVVSVSLNSLKQAVQNILRNMTNRHLLHSFVTTRFVINTHFVVHVIHYKIGRENI